MSWNPEKQLKQVHRSKRCQHGEWITQEFDSKMKKCGVKNAL